ncbi:undecaprenyl/decaprenyl-phosphate alpha-N-acetylglucosaminyl 1-phosphate transferase [Algoriphagus sp. H41]|uniref:Undecaprenyl/decaprenyl-phosphate alpha-N-acetylglucosaminyl 1-phosphate transferase n=1 Tax=Algoriphagus oliviformis TaxID=2811231 RepID=A0ABS3C8L7_9BACT|nr:MraY family glycosyltransferase [Algoriphagus oliviformis]MBN7813456.1 undecaprenyl/decaprenyl-phosphate alpha-N-acetylglucosaminyl 1-phosphate transferase [Algoriphagus oliviformis]
MPHLFSFLASFFVGLSLFPVLIKVFQKYDFSDSPGRRKVHKVSTPSMGGIGFLVAAFVALSIWAWQFPVPDIRYLLGGIAVMAFVGLRDDMVELRASGKIMGQLLSVLLVVVVGDMRISNFHGFLGIYELPLVVSYCFSSFVLLALTNAFNLIDGLDGLAGTIGGMTLAILGAWFYIQGLDSLAILSLTLLGGLLAFMVYNWHPAKIFMGDTGSLTLGFALGSLIIAFMEHNSSLPTGSFLKLESSFTAGIVLMIYPLYDMARVFARRISKGQHPMAADKTHIHHFLMRMGLRHDQVALVLGFLQFNLIILVFALGGFSDNLVLPILSSVVLFLGYLLERTTLKFVKKKVKNSPRVLDSRPLAMPKKVKVKLDRQSVESGSMNLN